ncbi:MAG: CHAT domain-containing protein [Cyanobacteria bacterium J06648_16]
MITSLMGLALTSLLADLFTPDLPTTFVESCLQRQQSSPAEQHTLAQLLALANTTDCQTADAYLSTLTTLDLQNRQITNLAPLVYFPQLETLYLGNNQIANLTPLAALPQLTELYLFSNQITDLQPLAQLPNLSTLYLDDNSIQDLNPLSNLNQLEILFANNNQIETISPLANLPNLTQLYLAHNQIGNIETLRFSVGEATLLPPQLTHLNLAHNSIESVAPLTELIELQELDISANRIPNLTPLTPLTQLTYLDSRSNPLNSKACPIFPATICLFDDDAVELRQLAGQQQLENVPLAIETLELALATYYTNGDQLRQSDTLDHIGNLYDSLGQYANALKYYQQAANIRSKAGDRQGESDTLTNLGITYIRLGQTEKALSLLEQALDLQQQLTPRDRPEPRQGRILSSLALAHSRLDNAPAALHYAKLSLANHRRTRDRNGEALALNRVGAAYLQIGNVDKAQRYLNRALDVSQAQADPTNTARSFHNLGDLAHAQGNMTAALAHYQQAQSRWQQLKDPAAEGHTLNAIGELYLDTGQISEAVTTLRRTVSLWESLRPGLTDANKVSLAETQTQTYQMLQQALVTQNNTSAALEVSESSRARAFAELLAHRLTLQGKTPPALELQSPSIAQIQAIARSQNATLVEYALLPKELYIWVVEPSGQVHFRRQPMAAETLSGQVINNRRALGVRGRGSGFASSFGPGPLQSSRRQLYQLLIEPIAELLPADSTVIIVPQAELFLVPFPALQDKTGTDLIERHPLLFAPAIGVLNPTQSASPLHIGEASALVVGNPVMPLDPATGAPLPPLSGAQQEAIDIAPLLNTQPLIGPAATKSAVIEQMSEATIAHFATHGLLDDFGTGVPGALALTPTDEDTGFLTAAEIFDLPLSARLVVLSACDTGRGKITGDGVLGLSRSFLTAGVESVVVSLWSVPDEATAVLMTEFYRQLQLQPNRAVALQQAMLTTRDRYPQPSHWAAFALFGTAGIPSPSTPIAERQL